MKEVRERGGRERERQIRFWTVRGGSLSLCCGGWCGQVTWPLMEEEEGIEVAERRKRWEAPDRHVPMQRISGFKGTPGFITPCLGQPRTYLHFKWARQCNGEYSRLQSLWGQANGWELVCVWQFSLYLAMPVLCYIGINSWITKSLWLYIKWLATFMSKIIGKIYLPFCLFYVSQAVEKKINDPFMDFFKSSVWPSKWRKCESSCHY